MARLHRDRRRLKPCAELDPTPHDLEWALRHSLPVRDQKVACDIGGEVRLEEHFREIVDEGLASEGANARNLRKARVLEEHVLFLQRAAGRGEQAAGFEP